MSIKTYVESGLSVLPIQKNSKKPARKSWKELCVTPLTVEQAEKEIRGNIAIIGGAISGGLVIIDVDTKYDLTGNLWAEFSQSIKEYDPELYNALTIAQTPSGGYHLYYRSGLGMPSGKLAMRPATDEELAEENIGAEVPILEKHKLPFVLIEVKSEGGYCLAFPSIFEGKPYAWMQGDATTIPTLSTEQHDAILFLASSFDVMPVIEDMQPPKKTGTISNGGSNASDGDCKPPYWRFNEAHSVLEVLERYGWRRGKNFNTTCWEITRPGKEHLEKSGMVAISANQNVCRIWTTSTILPTDCKLSAFDVYKWYEHGGDGSAANGALRKMGYGDKSPRTYNAPPPMGNAAAQNQNPPVQHQEEPNRQSSGADLTPFVFLGYRKLDGVQSFCFFVRSSKIIVEFTASKLGKSNLLTLADLQWWESEFPARKGGLDVYAAQNWIIQQSNFIGFFDSSKVRGRGAWFESGRSVIHTGNNIIVGGISHPLGSINTEYIYEAAASLEISVNNPLRTKQANRLLEVVELLPFARAIDAKLLAGWCVIAPICGALLWRPHIWLTGGKGVGKSWIFLNIVRSLLGKTALAVQGKSTESGIRQTLKFDAVPVVFDELEPDDPHSNQRIQNVLALMRTASADDGGMHLVGSSSGVASGFRMRSCFAFASISVALEKASDKSRVTVLELQKKGTEGERAEQFKKLNALHHEVITPEFISGLHARTVGLIPTIIANAATFARAAASVIGNQRTGDQIGALLAGVYTLYSDKVVKYEDALKFVERELWSEEKEQDSIDDETQLLSYMMEYVTDVDTKYRSFKRSIGELVKLVARGGQDDVTPIDAARRLARIGIRVENGDMIVSNTAQGIRAMLITTPWANNHNKILLRIDGATPTPSAVRFGAEKPSKGTIIPLSVFNWEPLVDYSETATETVETPDKHGKTEINKGLDLKDCPF